MKKVLFSGWRRYHNDVTGQGFQILIKKKTKRNDAQSAAQCEKKKKKRKPNSL